MTVLWLACITFSALTIEAGASSLGRSEEGEGQQEKPAADVSLRRLPTRSHRLPPKARHVLTYATSRDCYACVCVQDVGSDKRKKAPLAIALQTRGGGDSTIGAGYAS
jgi:hypothetical protein